MKKLILVTIGVFAFAGMPKNHMDTNDAGLKLAFAGKYKAALKNFSDRCDTKNDAWACGEAGYFYFKGWGSAKNTQLANKYYKKGCEFGDSDSCALLGYETYSKGNKLEAKKLIDKACKLGNKTACSYLKSKF